MIEPLDRGSLTFFLEFVTGNEGRKQIAEPAKFDAANFVLEQEEGRFGRDVSFAGGTIDLEFYNKTFQNGLTHEFTLIQEYHRRYGFDSQIRFIVNEAGTDFVIGELDYQNATTDQIEVFRCTILQENEQAIIKRRMETDVDLFSTQNLDGGTIPAISSEVLLIQAKPRNLRNELGLAFNGDRVLRQNLTFETPRGNVYTQIRGSDIQTPHQAEFKNPDTVEQIDRSHVLVADRSIKKVRIKVENVDIRYKLRTTRDLANFPIYFGVEKGETYSTRTVNLVDNRIRIDDNLQFEGTEPFQNGAYTWNVYRKVLNFEFEADLEIIAGEKLWLWFDLDVPTGSSDAFDRDELVFLESAGTITIVAEETDLNSVTRSIRLIDAMKQVCLSIGGFTVTAPRFEEGGEFYDQRIFDGNLLRGFEDKPFYLSFEDILEQLQEWAGDYEITSNGQIFFGIYEDFYTNTQIADLSDRQPGNLDKRFNERYKINKFNYRYKDFEEDRDEEGTLESVHTNTKFLLPNTQVENEKDIEVPFIRDPFLLESTRVRSIEVKEDTSLSQDNKKFIIEAVTSTTPFVFTEIVVLNHLDPLDGNVRLLNDGSFSWSRIGVQVTTDFTAFTLNNVNPENYRVIEVQDSLIVLQPQNPITTIQQGSFSTSFTYSVLSATIKNATNENFTLIQNVTNTEGYSNLSFTTKRNINNYWAKYIDCACHFQRGKTIRNTFFKNNRLLTTQKTGETATTVEGENILVDSLPTRILTPNYYLFEVRSNFRETVDLRNNIRNQRGYITFLDNRGERVQLHVSNLTYSWADQKLIIEGEERYQIIDFLTITCVNNIIRIQQTGFDDIVTNQIIVNIENENVLIYDKEMLLLRGPIKFFNISVSGQTGSSASEVKELLDNIC